MVEMEREFQYKMREIEAELQADLRREQSQAEMGSLENIAKEQAKTVEEAERMRFRPIEGGRA